jgi:hypothetical protein
MGNWLFQWKRDRLLLSDIVWFKVIALNAAYCIAFSLEEEMINYFSSLDVALNL